MNEVVETTGLLSSDVVEHATCLYFWATVFSAHICCGQMAAQIKIPLGMEVGLGPGRLCVRWGPCSPSPKKGGGAPKFSAHVYCGQTAGWIKIILHTEVASAQATLRC